jgi:RHH-type transcriptional regulator, proline utilization regulon repressor / proline dehydrogenase / delta 1-pyrroline-5-carboxylate dehydrogenase
VTSTEAVDDVVSAARDGLTSWSSKNGVERATILRRLAGVVADQRLQIISALSMYAAKTIAEADPEVSEAIDFANYYALQAEQLDVLSSGGSLGGSLDESPEGSRPLGVIVVAPPWNFAYAIALGGVTAALAAGNTVILKPTPQTPQIAQLIAAHCWSAGVPKSALHLLAVPDDQVGQHLITHDGVDAVILTGGVQTAQLFLSWKPTLHLLAETSGKNALVITATADLDLAIKDLVKSAFGHAGQKCSAASLAIVEASVYDDPAFMSRLADAVTTLNAGRSTDPATDIPPLIESPSPHLLRALTQLEAGETWLVAPRNWDVSDDRAWTPGVRAGVAPDSWFHTTECFGPVLGLIRADDLDHAIRIQNHVAFGLTAGIHALDPAEVALWAEAVQAGNLYVNRSITGAIVGRQPFGGWKASSVGPTAKAGGPSYVLGLRQWTGTTIGTGTQPGTQPGTQTSSGRCPAGFEYELASLFATEIEIGGMKSESNVLRYRPLPKGVLVRVAQDLPKGVAEFSVMLARAAARATNCSLTISSTETETDSQFVSRLAAIRPDRLRAVGTLADEIRSAAHGLGITIDDGPIVPLPAVELTRWSREQSVSTTMHRHGRLNRAGR